MENIAKCHLSLKNFDYLIMFDLASKITGVCVYDIHNNKPVLTKILKVTGKEPLAVAELNSEIKGFFHSLFEDGYDLTRCLVSCEAMPQQVHGGSSTIKTFIALARSHAIFDKYMYDNNMFIYDYVGVYPISMKAYAKHLMGVGNDFKIEKEHIRDLIYKLHPEFDGKLTLDESDAIFLAKTLIDVKWNKDLDEEIKEQKRHKKTLKMKNAIENVDKEIIRLQSLKH